MKPMLVTYSYWPHCEPRSTTTSSTHPAPAQVEGAVRNREPGLPGGGELAGAAGEGAQRGREVTAGGDRGGDEAREAVEAAGRDDALVHGEARAPPEYAHA
ncbi:hypothetical protein STTU_p0022 (plasmid) [Streptomyces sp. Tu6071]|nr:hypothetical protein STTU_p0022 [Streptomyces sp. Tu6071]